MSISLTLRLTGDFLNPEEITSILNVAPHTSRRKENARIGSSNNKVISKFGLWTWKSEDPTNTLTINDHVNRFRSTFEHVHVLFPNLPNVENAWIDVCVVDCKDEVGDSSVSFLLDKESIDALSVIGLPLEFTIYRTLPDDEQ